MRSRPFYRVCIHNAGLHINHAELTKGSGRGGMCPFGLLHTHIMKLHSGHYIETQIILGRNLILCSSNSSTNVATNLKLVISLIV